MGSKVSTFAIGGRVRDHIAGQPAAPDWDLGTSASYRTIRKIRRDARVDDHSHTDLTLVLLTANGVSMEITQFRQQHDFDRGVGVDHDARASSLAKDLGGRDFDVNAMAYDPLEKCLYDPYAGRQHLQRGILQALPGPLDRFRFDPVRILRGVRIASNLGLSIEDGTVAAMRDVARSQPEFSRIRARRELIRILQLPRAGLCFKRLGDVGAFPWIEDAIAPLAADDRLWKLFVAALDAVGEPRQRTVGWAILIGAIAMADLDFYPNSLERPEQDLRVAVEAARTRLAFKCEPPDARIPDRGVISTEVDEEELSPSSMDARIAADAIIYAVVPSRHRIWADLSNDAGDRAADDCAEVAYAWEMALRSAQAG